MGTRYVILGQAAPAATTETELFTVGASEWVEFYIYYCEEGNAAAMIRISISAAGGATASKDYIRYNYPLSAYGADEVGPLYAQGGYEINVYASTADCNFTATGKKYIITGA